MSTSSTHVQHKGEQKTQQVTNPSNCYLLSSRYASPSNPVLANEFLLRAEAKDAETDRKARRIALIATEQIDQLSLAGYPGLGPAYAAVVETTIFYVVRGVLEDA